MNITQVHLKKKAQKLKKDLPWVQSSNHIKKRRVGYFIKRALSLLRDSLAPLSSRLAAELQLWRPLPSLKEFFWAWETLSLTSLPLLMSLSLTSKLLLHCLFFCSPLSTWFFPFPVHFLHMPSFLCMPHAYVAPDLRNSVHDICLQLQIVSVNVAWLLIVCKPSICKFKFQIYKL